MSLSLSLASAEKVRRGAAIQIENTIRALIDGSPMRFIKRLCVPFGFCLAFGLACSEIPESLSLADDAPTDFMQVVALATPSKPRYRVVHKLSVWELIEDLRHIPMEGHKVLTLSHGRRDRSVGQTMILERLPENSGIPDYMIAKTSGVAGAAGVLERELNLSAFNGFRAVPHGAFLQTEYQKSDPFVDFLFSMARKDHEIHHSTIIFKSAHVLMERGPDRSVKCHYLVPRSNFNLQDKKARRALAEGRRMVGAVAADGMFFGPDLFLIMEHCATSFSEAAKAPAQANLTPSDASYLVLNTYNVQKAQKELNKAAGRGYRPLFSDGGLLALNLVTKQPATQQSQCEFRILAEGDASAFEKGLNSSPGLRMVNSTMSVTEKARDHSRRLFVVLEKVPNGVPNVRYRVLIDQNSGISQLQDEVNAAADQGYRVMGVTDDASGTTVIMEGLPN